MLISLFYGDFTVAQPAAALDIVELTRRQQQIQARRLAATNYYDQDQETAMQERACWDK